MENRTAKKTLPFLLLFLLLVTDQAVKFHIKLNFSLGESVRVFDWFQLVFVENPGMAFGLTIGSKAVLTSFRIILSGAVLYYIIKLIKDNYSWGYITLMVFILAGAIGNIIDCVFYGKIFSISDYNTVATLFPADGGYAPLFMGKVVDMFYFPLFTFPDWMPLLGGEVFFSPVFNVADSYITVSVFVLIIFFRNQFNETMERYFSKTKTEKIQQ